MGCRLADEFAIVARRHNTKYMYKLRLLYDRKGAHSNYINKIYQ